MVSTRSTNFADLVGSTSTTTSKIIDSGASDDETTLPSTTAMLPSTPSFFAIFISLLIISPLAFVVFLLHDIDTVHSDNINYTGIALILFYWASISLGRAYSPKAVDTIISTLSAIIFMVTVLVFGTCVFEAVHDKPGFPNGEAWTPVAVLTAKCAEHVRETGRFSDPYPRGAAYQVTKAVGQTAFKVTREQAIAWHQGMVVAARHAAALE